MFWNHYNFHEYNDTRVFIFIEMHKEYRLRRLRRYINQSLFENIKDSKGKKSIKDFEEISNYYIQSIMLLNFYAKLLKSLENDEQWEK